MLNNTSLRHSLIPRKTRPSHFGDTARKALTSSAIAIPMSFVEAISVALVIGLFYVIGSNILDSQERKKKAHELLYGAFIAGVIIFALKNIYMGVYKNWYLNHLQRDILLIRNASLSFFLVFFTAAPATSLRTDSRERVSMGELLENQLLGFVIILAGIIALMFHLKILQCGIKKWCNAEEERDAPLPSPIVEYHDVEEGYTPPFHFRQEIIQEIEMPNVVSSKKEVNSVGQSLIHSWQSARIIIPSPSNNQSSSHQSMELTI